MKSNRYIVICLLSFFLAPCSLWAEQWKTYFAYNNVTQIAMSSDLVYGISDGSLYSVNKQTEALQVYSTLSGLHATGITCIYYDTTSKQLIIGYKTGKIDLLSKRGVKYIGELYDKDMTQRKTINNITTYKYTAYISTAFGIQTMDLRTDQLVDSYWLRPGGLETDVVDVVIRKDSIYAFTTDSMFCAALKDNLVDYTFWKREKRSNRITPDKDKGKHYTDNDDNWYAAQADGILRVTPTGQMTYKPKGPLGNIPYHLTACQGQLWMLQGGGWAAQFNRSGIVMRWDGSNWHNIQKKDIQSKLQDQNVLDFMNVAVDPKDKTHYFIPSYGTGLYEFRADTFYRHFTADGTNALQSVLPNYKSYTRLNCATFDNEGNLWVLCAGGVNNQVACYDHAGNWHAIRVIVNGAMRTFNTPSALIFDKKNPHYKWIVAGRSGTGLCLIDDKGDPLNDAIHEATEHRDWVDQFEQLFIPTCIYTARQMEDGRIWLGTEIGLAIIDTINYFESNACLRPTTIDDNGENPLTTFRINALCQIPNGEVWVGTETNGIYVVDDQAAHIIAHYTTENSALPTSGILSLAYDEVSGTMYIGTQEGLVAYNPNGIPGGLKTVDDPAITSEEENEYVQGSMHNWTLHLSYSDPQEMAATSNSVFAVANGSLFSVDRDDESIQYWNKSTGLNGSTVSHIAYDASSLQLIIAYADGRMDLLHTNGTVTQMPDLVMKAGTVATAINCITVGSRNAYVGTPFGIMALNTRKAEIADTYYIGEDASSIDVQHILEAGDTLYAISYNRLYKASLQDNLVDYSFWKSEDLPFETVQQASIWHDTVYVLANDSLYRRERTGWNRISTMAFKWIYASEGQLLAYNPGGSTYRLTEKGLSPVTTKYSPNDGLYTKGEYWLAQTKTGLIRLDNAGDSYFNAGGPNSNYGYFITTAHDHVYTTIGGRWGGPYVRFGRINIYNGEEWICIENSDIGSAIGKSAVDISSLAVDPADAGHFFAATYGRGVFEFRDYKAVMCYSANNSSLRECVDGIDPAVYTWTDGAMMDDDRNLWVLNATSVGQPIHVMTPDGTWHPLRARCNGQYLKFTTPTGIWPDKRNGRYKWMMDQRNTQGLILFDDGGTPAYNGDDYCFKRSNFVDQNGHLLTPNTFRCFAQDKNNKIWIGTETGLITIPASVDFYTSNECRRIIIPRNDGSGLGDYLLGDEQINCMAVDGGNRMWIGTANSGLYLIEDDTITVAHFTAENSILPSNSILSISIRPKTGDVFVGTDKGIASYRSDASEPQADMSTAYAYPNPVYPEYEGFISITGLMDNTVVNIVDAAGNLVCKTRSHGGTAVWDGKLYDGRKATPGVYSALCNAEGGHTVVKILIIR